MVSLMRSLFGYTNTTNVNHLESYKEVLEFVPEKEEQIIIKTLLFQT